MLCSVWNPGAVADKVNHVICTHSSVIPPLKWRAEPQQPYQSSARVAIHGLGLNFEQAPADLQWRKGRVEMPDNGEPSTGRQDSTQSLGSVNEVDVSNVTLEQLLDYLLATKRSLAATDHVWRANQLVHAAREALVEVIELRARSIFVIDGITSQLKILQNIKSGIEQVAWRGRTEFEVPTIDSGLRPGVETLTNPDQVYDS